MEENMSVLGSLKIAGFAYVVLIVISFMVAGLIQCMTIFLKARAKDVVRVREEIGINKNTVEEVKKLVMET
jgi:hypothetical protein